MNKTLFKTASLVLMSALISACAGVRGFGSYENHADLSSAASVIPYDRNYSIYEIDGESFLFGNGAKTVKPGPHSVTIVSVSGQKYSSRCNTEVGHIYSVSLSGCADTGSQVAYNDTEQKKGYQADKGFHPVSRNSLSARQQNALIGLLEFKSRRECDRSGARGARWTRMNDQDYQISLKAARAQLQEDNKLAQQFADAPSGAPVAGARLKVEPNERDGLGVHVNMAAVRATDAHEGLSCLKDVQRGAVNIKGSFASVEAWVTNENVVLMRSKDDSTNKQKYSTVSTLTWEEVGKVIGVLVEQDKVDNF